MRPRVLSCGTMIGTNVKNREGQNLGEIKEIMINTRKGSIAYFVLSYGGFLGLGDKLFAVPFEAFNIDDKDEEFVLNVAQEKLKNAPGFDKNNWPKTANDDYFDRVSQHYGYQTQWPRRTEPVS